MTDLTTYQPQQVEYLSPALADPALFSHSTLEKKKRGLDLLGACPERKTIHKLFGTSEYFPGIGIR